MADKHTRKKIPHLISYLYRTKPTELNGPGPNWARTVLRDPKPFKDPNIALYCAGRAGLSAEVMGMDLGYKQELIMTSDVNFKLKNALLPSSHRIVYIWLLGGLLTAHSHPARSRNCQVFSNQSRNFFCPSESLPEIHKKVNLVETQLTTSAECICNKIYLDWSTPNHICTLIFQI